MYLPAKKVSFAPAVTSYVFYQGTHHAVQTESSPLQDPPLLTMSDNQRLRLFFHTFRSLNAQASTASSLTKEQLDSLLHKSDLLYDKVMRTKASFGSDFIKLRQGYLLAEPLRKYLDDVLLLECELSILKVTILVARCLNK